MIPKSMSSTLIGDVQRFSEKIMLLELGKSKRWIWD